MVIADTRDQVGALNAADPRPCRNRRTGACARRHVTTEARRTDRRR